MIFMGIGNIDLLRKAYPGIDEALAKLFHRNEESMTYDKRLTVTH